MSGKPPATGAPVRVPPAQEQSFMQKGMRYLMLFMASQAIVHFLSSQFGKTTSKLVGDSANPDASQLLPTPEGPITNATKFPPMWPQGTGMSLLIYTSESEEPSSINFYEETPLVTFSNITYGDWKGHRETEVMVDLPLAVQNNGSYYSHLYLVADAAEDGRRLGEILRTDPKRVVHQTKILSRYFEKTKAKKAKKLIGGEEQNDAPEETGPAPIVSHWASNLTLTVISEVAFVQMNPILEPYMIVEDNRYYPIIYPNDFWLLKESQFPINSTTPQVPLRVTYDPIGFMKFNIYASMTHGWEQEKKSNNPNPLTGPSIDPDEIKKLLLSANPYWAAATAILGVLHMLFEFLAFKSDVGHWRKTDKNLVGVSLRTIITNVVTQVIILLYLLDSGEQTSNMILLTNGMGIMVEVWKITKVIDIKYHAPAPGSTLPTITFEDKKELTEDEKRTREYDALAFRIVGAVAIPTLMAYAAYSLKNHEYKGWYSFVVTTLAEAVYMFGFAQLVPQLIINYKLKSVAHLPMKSFFYKVLGTVIDDFGSMVIPMPWLHRLACFRDDVVFVVLLYQRWIYRIDYSRANEYGQVLEVEPDAVHEGVAGKIIEDLPKQSQVLKEKGKVLDKRKRLL